jgi:ketosteroid isomerase-like protein
MPHPNETLLRDAYAAFGRGDIEGYWSVCAPEFTFNVPGRNAMAGSYSGKDTFMGMVGKVMQLTAGQFQEEVHDVLANDEHGVVLAIHRFTRNGQAFEYRTAHVYELCDGRLQECWEQPQDQAAFDAAWT